MPTQRIADPYATLGVARAATPSQVRAAYRRLAKRYHPDVHADPRATERMRDINQAWEVLSTADRRAQYDSSLASQGAAPGYGHWAGVPRRAQPAASPQWTSYAGAGAYDRAAAYRRARGNAGETSGWLRWGAILLIVPVAVISLAILSAGVLPIPLLGFLLVVIVSSLARRDG